MRVGVLFLIVLFLPCVNPWWPWDEIVAGVKILKDAVVLVGTVAITAATAVVTGGGSLAVGIPAIITAGGNLVNSINNFNDVQVRRMQREAEEANNAKEQKRRENNNAEQDKNIERLNEELKKMQEGYKKHLDEMTYTVEQHKASLNLHASALQELDIKVSENFGALKTEIAAVEKLVEKQLLEIYNTTSSAIKHLDHNIAHQFRAISNLKVELQFTEEIMLTTDILERLMIQNMRFPTKDTCDEFVEQYKIKGPRQILMDLTNRLKYKYTNSLSAAMELNIFKSKKIFDRWFSNIGDIAYKLLYIEGFYFGLVEYPKIANQDVDISKMYYDPTLDAIVNLGKELQSFKESYKVSPSVYWPDLVVYNIEELLKNNEIYARDKERIADEIQTMLGNIYTSDIFTIHVAETENGEVFDNKNTDNSINVKDFYAASPRGASNSAQLTFFNPSHNIAISVVRSETHLQRTDDDNFVLNEIFFNTIPPGHSSLSNEKFGELMNKINEEMGGDIGGVVLSKQPIAERVTNGAKPALLWHNQVPGDMEYVNVMWI